MKKIVKGNKKIMVCKIVRLSKKISRHLKIVKEIIQIRKEIFHASKYDDKSRIMKRLKYETPRKTAIYNN